MTVHSSRTLGQLVGISSMELWEQLNVWSLGVFQRAKGKCRRLLWERSRFERLGR